MHKLSNQSQQGPSQAVSSTLVCHAATASCAGCRCTSSRLVERPGLAEGVLPLLHALLAASSSSSPSTQQTGSEHTAWYECPITQVSCQHEISCNSVFLIQWCFLESAGFLVAMAVAPKCTLRHSVGPVRRAVVTYAQITALARSC